VQRLAIITLLSSATIALFLGGCKADSGKVDTSISERASTPQPAAKPPDTRPVIVCFGDSITAGYNADPGQSYPDDLQKILDADNYPYRVINEGISGNTTKDAVDRLAHIISLHPQLVVVEFGGNDGLRGLPLEQTKSNMASIIDQLQTAHVQVALAGITLPPDYGPDYIKKFNAIYPALAREYHVPLLPFLYKKVYGVPGDIQPDGIHATDKGNKQVAANIAALIEPVLQH
jgi:acyl-CoA thioesterase-1